MSNTLVKFSISPLSFQIGVFDNCRILGGDKTEGIADSRIGEVRMQLLRLKTNRSNLHIHTSSVTIIFGGDKRPACEVQSSHGHLLFNELHIYSQLPLLPKMHYILPI